MCKAQDVVSERRDHSAHQLHLINISDHRAVVCTLKWDLGRPFETRQGFMMSPFFFFFTKSCAVWLYHHYRNPVFVYNVKAEKVKALY